MGPPSGGPVDREAPRIVSHTPSADATQVAADQLVEIVFSESMNRASVEEAVFIAPAVESELSWNDTRLNVVFRQPLQDDRTYVVTVGTGSRDLRRNSLDRSYTFAFATGDQINQGLIVGHVFSDHSPAVGANVWAFDHERLTGRMGSGAPDYQTQTGKDGSYEFSKLSATGYRVMAFDDEDRDRSYDPGESMGLGSSDLLVEEDGETAAGYLAIAKPVRPRPALERVQAVHDRAILLEFTRPVDPEQVDVEIDGLQVDDLYRSPPGGAKVYAVTQAQEGGREYRLARLAVGDSVIAWSEPVRGRGRSDNKAPNLVEKHPDRSEVGPTDSLKILFSEAMEPDIPSNFWIDTDSSRTLAGAWSWESPTTLVFAPGSPMSSGDHKLVGRPTRMSDRSGNALVDSLITFAFTVLDPGNMPGISGRTAIDTNKVWVVARLLQGSRKYEVMAKPTGEYEITGMLPGSYNVYAYVDRDGNGRQDYGNLDPYLAAEPYLRAQGPVELTADAGTMEIDLLPFAGE